MMLRGHLPKTIQHRVTNAGQAGMAIPSGYPSRVVRIYLKPMDVVRIGEDRQTIQQWADVVVEKAW